HPEQAIRNRSYGFTATIRNRCGLNQKRLSKVRMSTSQEQRHTAIPRFGRIDADLAEVESSILKASEHLLSLQHPDGYWCGELEADSMLEADYIFLHKLLESGDPRRMERAHAEMWRYQNADGSWSLY